ncbi:CYFA0S14e01112g1_1 [Cyberlindnera fabianii]|uniref:CYFA0S14e01112g1_1 n=1 Tax=Cyberlindnera fabianii TaxID=36022 RepID=A0A061BBB4_CYBFA|nr:CYFA0S14e01112g1_1 [Cyberlindnera fabianii]
MSSSSHDPTPESTDSTEAPVKSKSRKRASFLTDEEKKRHHIESEHKRRQAIRDAFLKLAIMVPDLKESDSRSEQLVMDRTSEHLVRLYEENEELLLRLEAKGVPVDQSLKIVFPNGAPSAQR